jgi:hypothetical protein
MKSKDMSLVKSKDDVLGSFKIPTKEIAAHLGVHPSTIWRHLAILKELLLTGSPMANKPRSGCLRIAIVCERRLGVGIKL